MSARQQASGRSGGSRTGPDSDRRPSIELENYYHGKLPREDVETMLKKKGDFLVRSSVLEGAKVTVLSVMWDDAVHHFVFKEIRRQFCLESDGKMFPNKPALILFHVKKKQPLTKLSKVVLGTPVTRENWELKHSNITRGEKIGEGQYGEVFQGKLKLESGKTMLVAVKTLSDMEEENWKPFMKEARIMRRFKHPNIVEILGVATQEEPLMLVMEFVSGGDLLGHLRKNVPKISAQEKSRFALDVAKGMKYLEKQRCIHRDLAARNCLLTKKKVVKISDFGLSCTESQYNLKASKRKVPTKWLAPEVLKKGIYTSKSDVWSFGILLWEIFSDGAEPYADKSNEQVRQGVASGTLRLAAPPETPGRPQAWPEFIRTILHNCFKCADDRPKFSTIKDDLERGRQRSASAPPDNRRTV